MSHNALVGRALTLLRQDDPEAALECANEVIEALRSGAADKGTELSALCACVDAHLALSDATKALSKAEEASSVAKSMSGAYAEAAPALAMAKVKLYGSQESKEALGMLREIGATWGETAVLLSAALMASKEPAQARSLLERARRLQQRWQETFALLTLSLAALPKGSPALTDIDSFLAVAKKHGVTLGDADGASSVRRLQGCSTMEDLQEIHDRLSAAAKAGQRSAQAWATLDMADAKLSQGSLKVKELDDAISQLQKAGSKEGLAMGKLEASRSHLACGRPTEALKEAQLAAKSFKELGDLMNEATACSACALAHADLGQLPEAVALASKAPQDLAERGLRRACADALRVASKIYLEVGEHERAMQVGLEAAAALRDVGDSRGEAFALLHEVASAYLSRKEVDSALNVASSALRLLRAAEDLPGELAALKATAEIHLCRGDTEPALRLLQEVISLSHDSGDLSDEVDAHVTCARLRVRRCEGSEATSSVEAAMGAARNEGGLIEAKAMMGMAKVLQAKEEMTAARDAATKAATLFKQNGYAGGQMLALNLCWQCMAPADAVKAAQQSAKAFQSSNDLHSAADALLAACEWAEANTAAELASEALQQFRTLNHTKGEAKALHQLSMAEAGRARAASSIKAAVDVVALYTKRGDLRGQADATCHLAKVYLDLGLLKDALSEVGEARLAFQKLQHPQLEEAHVLLDVAIPAYMALNDPPKAVAMAEDAANICRSLGDRVGEANALKACAKVCVQKNDTKSALQASRQAAAVLSRARLAREEAEAYHLTAKVHLLRSEPREAVSSAAQALTLLRRPGDEDEKAAVLVTASYAHSMALEYDGAVGTATEAVELCRRTGNKLRLKMAMHALAEGYLIKGDFGQAMDATEEAQQKEGDDQILEARLLEVSCYARLGWLSSKKKGLRANPRDLLQKAQAASATLLASGNKRMQADAKFLLGKVQLQAGNMHAAINEVTKAYELYGALKDGQGAGWTGLLYASCLLRAPAKLMAGKSAMTSKEIEVPQYDGAFHSALVAHSTFRRIGDEEGTEAALKVVNEIRSLGGSTLQKDMPRPRPLPPAFSSAPMAVVNPYHELVGGRQLPFQVPDLQVPPPETDADETQVGERVRPEASPEVEAKPAEMLSDETAARAGSELIFPSEAHAMKIQSQAGEMSRLGFAWALKALPTAGEIAA